MNSLFLYSDYRLYLRDYFEEKKQQNRHFSLRVLAEKSGFKARDYLMRVMRGDRNLSLEGAEKLSQYFRFSEKQSEYFQALVQFNQAETTEEKEQHWRRLSEIQKYGVHQRLKQDQYEYLSAWYHSALRSLLPVIDCKDDWEAVARMLDPPISTKQARDSVELMVRLGLLQKDAKGKYQVSQPALSTGDDVASVAVAAFHKSTMDLVKRSIDRHPAESRDVSGLTMSISNEGYRRIRSEIRAFRKKLMSIVVSDSGEDMVYQFNMHLVPLTKNRGLA